MLLPDNNYMHYDDATVSTITKEEYDTLIDVEVEDVVIPEQEPIVEEPTQPDEWLEFVKEAKIKQLSSDCENTIKAGFDWNNQHYSLTI